MGVLNVTPDSFFDGGLYRGAASALNQAEKLLAEGADILDVGGESTRPGAKPVSEEEELARVVPIVKAIRKAFKDAAISVDTQKSEVARQALESGASIVNDVSALRADSNMVSVVAKFNAKVVLMHMRKDPQTMQKNPRYKNAADEILKFLLRRMEFARAQGIARKNIWVDPGIGFGKNLQHNLDLLRNLKNFKSLNAPIVLGCSRKSFIGMLDGGAAAQDRLGGSVAAALWGARQGASILRVHDVAQTRQALKVLAALSTKF